MGRGQWLYPSLRCRPQWAGPVCTPLGRRRKAPAELCPAGHDLDLVGTSNTISAIVIMVYDSYWLVVEPYPSEKWWSSSVGMTWHSQYMEVIKDVPNHQPGVVDITIVNGVYNPTYSWGGTILLYIRVFGWHVWFSGYFSEGQPILSLTWRPHKTGGLHTTTECGLWTCGLCKFSCGLPVACFMADKYWV